MEAIKSSRLPDENEKYLRAIVENAESCMAILDASGKIKSFLGSERIMNRSNIPFRILITEIIDKDKNDNIRRKVAEVSATKMPLVDKKMVSSHGSEYFLKDSYYPVENADGSVTEVGIIREDISESSEIREQYQSLVDNSIMGLLIFQDDRIVFANQKMADLTGYDHDQLLNRPACEFIEKFSDPRERTEVSMRIYRTSRFVDPFECRITRQSGSEMWIQLFDNEIIYNGHHALQVAFLDIDKRKRAESSLEMFKHVVNSTKDQIVFVDANSVIQLVNRELLVSFGKTKRDLLNRPLSTLFGIEYVSAYLDQPLFDCFSNKKFVQMLRWVDYPDGNERYVEFSLNPYIVEPDRDTVTGVVITLRDLTDTIDSDIQLIDIVENERRNIAMELHDGLTHDLLGISIQTKLLTQSLEREKNSHAVALASVNDSLNNAISYARNLSKGISPVHEKYKNLNYLLTELVSIAEKRYSIACMLSMPDNVELYDMRTLENIYYIIDEAITNAVKHANVSKVMISVSNEDGFISFSVLDNGPGFNPSASSDGMGIRFMKTRCRSISASFVIRSKQETGTEITFRLKSPTAASV